MNRAAPAYPILLLSTLTAAFAGPPALAQPGDFVDAGSWTAAAAPPSVREYIQLPALFDFGMPGTPGEVLTVKWLRFSVAQGVPAPLFLDIDTRVVSIDGVPGDVLLALYDANGNLVATDDTDGSFPETFAAGLSFGSSDVRLPPVTPALQGQDGPLASGTYWLAIVAGNAGTVTLGANWAVSTTASLPLGFLDPGTFYLSLDVAAGNTTPLDRPVNDRCQDAVTIGEDTPGGPAWTGSNAGATLDGFSPCFELVPPLEPRDVWVRYIPSATGYAEAVLSDGGAGESPILTRYGSDCESAPEACAGGSFFDLLEGVRLFFPVQQGQPVLLSAAFRSGGLGAMVLNVRLLQPACPLAIPAGAALESEGACGEASNNGCDVAPPAYDPVEFGRPITGTLFNTTSVRDVDWFEFTLTRPGPVTVTFAAQYPAIASVIGEPDPGACLAFVEFFVENTDIGATCRVFSETAELPAGTYRLAFAQRFFDGLDCGSGYEGYWLRVDAPGQEPLCRTDFNRDDVVNSTDVSDFVSAWFTDLASGATATDFDANGVVNSTDVSAFINTWFEETAGACAG